MNASGSAFCRRHLWAAPLVAALAVGMVRAEEIDHSQHAGHHMSADQLATLRAKLPLYQSYTDDQINENMTRMTDSEAYLSPAGVRNDVGVLALGHGYGAKGNEQFKAGFAEVAKIHPTAVGLGMSMMGSAHIRTALESLEAAGARTIIVLPTEVGERSNLTRQWKYIFGQDDRSAYLDVPRVTPKARILFAPTPTASPIVTAILIDNLRTVSKDPAREFGVVVAHGPTDEQENQEELAQLAVHARGIRKALGLSEVIAVTLQDDAPTAVRQANVDRLRERMKAASASGKRVIVTPLLITGRGYISMKIAKDLEGLDYQMADIGMAESPRFPQWVKETLAMEAAGSNSK
jgi:hypothetical protein